MKRPSSNASIGLAARWFAILLIALGLGMFVRRMDWGALRAAIASARIWPLGLVALLAFANLFCKAACWRIMLAPRYRVPTLRLFRYTVAAFAASAVTPARAGELLRVWLLKNRDAVPATDSFAVAAAEKVLDGVSMLIIVAPLPWLMPELPRSVTLTIGGLCAFAVALLVALWIAVGRVRPTGAFQRFIAGMEVLRRPVGFAGSLAVLLASWVADLLEVQLVLWAIGVHLPFAAGLLILLTLNLAIAVPSTPAQVGALELGAMAALELLHVPRPQALAFALLYHGMQVVPLLLVGLADIRFVLDARRRTAATPAESLQPD